MSHMSEEGLIWAALADSKRRQIVSLLEEKPRTTSEISEYFDVSRFAVMKHLKVLEQANLITTRREGRQRWNILNRDLAHFLRTKLGDGQVEAPHRLVDILGLFPGSNRERSRAANSQTVELRVSLSATPSQIFESITGQVDAWWSLRLARGSRVCMEPYVNGRFFEAFNDAGQGILYATVTYVKQDEEVRLRGTMGWQEEMGERQVRDGFIRMTLVPGDNSCWLVLSHALEGGMDEETRDAYLLRWRELLESRLKRYVEEGVAYPALI